MKSKLFLFILLIPGFCISCSSDKDDPIEEDKTIKDGSGNIYHEVTIGDQTWLKEDIRTTKYINGTDIQFVENWTSMNPAKPQYTIYKESYFYNYGSMSNDICPKGYHLPGKSDWGKLIDHFGGTDMGKEKVLELINALKLNLGSVSGGNEASAIYIYGFSNDIIYFRTNDGVIGYNQSASPSRIRCIKR